MSKPELMTDRVPFSISGNCAAIGGRETGSFSGDQSVGLSCAPQSLRVNVSWAFLGFAVYAASQWATLAIVARMCGPDGLGQFALALATTAPVMLLAGLELRLVQSADSDQKFAFAEYLAVRLIGIGVALSLIAAIGLFCGFDHLETNILIAVGFSKAVEATADVFYGQFQQRERMDLIARSLILRSMISICVFGSVIYVTSSLTAGIYAQSIAWIVVLLFFDVPSLTQFLPSEWSGVIRSRMTGSHLWQLAVMATPAGLRTMLLSFESNIPYYVLRYFSDERSLGVFAAMAYSLVIVQTFARSLNQPAVPRFAILFSKRDQAAFAKLLWQLCGMGLVIGLIGLAATLVIGKLFLTIAYGSEFADDSSILVILIFACAVRMITLPVAAAMAGTNQFVWLFRIQSLAVAVMGISAIVLVPSLGLQGAAYSVLLVSIVMLVSHYLAARVFFLHSSESNILKRI